MMIEAEKVTAILLAAGRSLRFGGADKLLVPVGGKPIILHAAERITELAPARRIVVCNNPQGAASDLLARLGFEIVHNPHPERGLSHSLACGISAAAQDDSEAALICLADMPFVSLTHLQRLLERFDPIDAPVTASGRDGVAMPPAVFARAMFGRLLEAEGDQGGRQLLGEAPLVEASAAELRDVDVPEDLRRSPTDDD